MDLKSMFPRRPKYRADVLRGPLGPYIDGFIGTVARAGYTPGSLRDLVRGAVRFGRYLATVRLRDLRKLGDRHVEAYIATTPCQHHGKYRFHVSPGARAAPHVLRYLRHIGLAPPPQPARRRFTGLLDEWLTFLRTHQGLAEKSVALYRRHIMRFLEFLGRDGSPHGLKRLALKRIRTYLHDKAAIYGRSERKALVSTLRVFLRWLFAHGYLQRDLAPFIDRVPAFKHEHLPRGPRWEDLPKLLDVPDRRTVQGRRDHAILLLLITYGIRAHQIGSLQLADIDWRGMTIRFRAAKRGRDVHAPLTVPAGEALFQYLRTGRPAATVRNLFLTLRPPIRPLLAASINTIVRRAFRLAGIPSPHHGSYAIRHAWATRMLAQGQPLKTIADLLGHRSIETTRIYAKVDHDQLREVALPWPGEGGR